MVVEVTVETRIGRTPTTVFSELAAVERYPEWLIASGIVGVGRQDAQPLAVGSRLVIRQTVAGRSSVIDAEITAFRPDMAIALKGRDPDGVSVQFEAALSPDGDLATTLRWSVSIGLPLKFRLFESMVAPQAKRAAALDVEAFRRRLEAIAEA